jgi:hypothetical protein
MSHEQDNLNVDSRELLKALLAEMSSQEIRELVSELDLELEHRRRRYH